VQLARSEVEKFRETAREGAKRDSELSFAVVMPAYNAQDTIGAALRAISESTAKPMEILVFDDGSTDRTAEIARTFGVTLLSGPLPKQGPGFGRTECAKVTNADVLVFVDADVSVWPDAIPKLLGVLSKNNGPAAAFGSYDSNPPGTNWAAKYANLRHHHFHQVGNRRASTFWTGFGAIRRDIFIRSSGFDSAYREPSIEDVELGARLRRAGHGIELVPEALATHSKNWTLIQLWRTDILRRALPWSRLLISGQLEAGTLNTSAQEKLSALLVLVALAAGFLSVWDKSFWIVVAIALSVYTVLNKRLLTVFWNATGAMGAGTGLVLHVLYHCYASLTYLFVLSTSWARRTLPGFRVPPKTKK
jgi:GT2 family glycosyltransferase